MQNNIFNLGKDVHLFDLSGGSHSGIVHYPEEVNYHNYKKRLISANPQTIFETSRTKNDSAEGDIVRIDLPNQDVYDFSTAILTFEAKTSHTSGTYANTNTRTSNWRYRDAVDTSAKATVGDTDIIEISYKGERTSGLVGLNTDAEVTAAINALSTVIADELTFSWVETTSPLQHAITVAYKYDPTSTPSADVLDYLNVKIISQTGSATGFLSYEHSRATGTSLTQNSFCIFNNYINTIIDEVVYNLGGQEVFEQKNFNLVSNLERIFYKPDNWDERYAHKFMGVGTATERASWSSDYRTYALVIHNWPFAEKYNPSKYIKMQQQIEIHLGRAADVLHYKGGSAQTFTTRNWRFYFDRERLDERIESEIQRQFSTCGFDFHFREYELYTFNNDSSTNTLNITEKASSISRIIMVIQKASEVIDPQYPKRFEKFYKDNLQTWQLRVRDDYHPAQPLRTDDTTDIDVVYHYARSFENWNMRDGMISDYGISDTFVDGQNYIVVMSLNEWKKTTTVNGKNTASNNLPLTIDLKFTSIPSTVQKITVILETDRELIITPTGYKLYK